MSSDQQGASYIKFVCTSCNAAFKLPAKYAGRKCKCKCGAIQQIPALTSDAAVSSVPTVPTVNLPKKQQTDSPPQKGIFKSWTLGTSDETQGVQYLQQVAFEIQTTGIVPPSDNVSNDTQVFLPRLDKARNDAVRFRQNFMANIERQFAAQGFAGFAAATVKDPVDEVLPGWFSLAVIFDYDKMDSSYGIQAFHAFFSVVSPEEFRVPAVIHFGDLIQFDTYCTLLLRTKSVASLAYVARQLGGKFEAPGLLPVPIRFLYAYKRDGHLIPRTFSLPISAELRPPFVTPDAKAGVNWIIEEAVKNTPWKKR